MIVGLMGWAHRHLGADDEVLALELVHRSCGHPAEPYLACAHCHAALTARDIVATVRG